MGVTDIPAVRGLALLASNPDLHLGPFAEVVAVSREHGALVLHRDGCPENDEPADVYEQAVPVTNLTGLAAIAANMPAVDIVPLHEVAWCTTCSPSNRKSEVFTDDVRGAWISLAGLLGNLDLVAERLADLQRAAGPALTWPREAWLPGRAYTKYHERALQLSALVVAYRVHPCGGKAVGLDIQDFAIELADDVARLVDLKPVGAVHGPELVACIEWAQQRVAAQHRDIRLLLRSFPLRNLTRGRLGPGEDVLVLTRRAVADRVVGPSWAPLVLETVALPVFANDTLVVLRIPEALVDDLSTPPLGIADVPDGDLTQVLQVAVTAASGQGSALRRDRELFASLVDAAVTAAA